MTSIIYPVHPCFRYTVNPHYTDTRYNEQIRYTDNLSSTETLSQRVTVNRKLCRNIIIQYFKQHMFWRRFKQIFKHMVYKENKLNMAFVAYHSAH